MALRSRRLRAAAGFTLIELLVVILIIGILIAVSAPSFLGQTQKAHDSATKQNLSVAYKAAAAYAVDGVAADGTADPNHIQGNFDGFNASALHGFEPELVGIDATNGACPAAAVNLPDNHIVIEAASGNNLTMCADPDGRVWTLRVVAGVLQPFPTNPDTGSGGATGFLNGDTPNAASGAPANDNYSNAQLLTLSGNSLTVNGTLVGATLQQGGTIAEESVDACAGGSENNFDSQLNGLCTNADASVWYYWVAPDAGTYQLDTLGSPAPFDGSGSNAAPVVEIVDLSGDGNWTHMLTAPWVAVTGAWGGGLNNEGVIQFNPNAGDTYLIRVTNYGYDQVNGPSSPVTPPRGAFKLTLSHRLDLLSSPSISGTVAVGHTLTADPGTWNPTPTSTSYQWESSPDGTIWTAIAGETTSSYTVQSGDIGNYLGVRVDVSTSTGVSSETVGAGIAYGPVPVAVITASPSDPSSSTTAHFVFDSTEPTEVVSFRCSLDGASYSPCSSPVDFSGLSNGSHTFLIKASDAGNNEQSTATSLTWTISEPAPATTFADQVTADGAVNYWRLGDTSSPLTDLGSSPMTMSAGGSPSYQQTDPRFLQYEGSNHAIGFSGSDYFLSNLSLADQFNGTSSFSVEAVFQAFPSVGVNQQIIHGGRWVLQLSPGGQVRFCRNDCNDGGLFSDTSLTAGNWYDVLATYDGSTMRIYVNGALDGSLASSTSDAASSANVQIAAASAGLQGPMDEAAIYPSALSSAQAAAHWNALN